MKAEADEVKSTAKASTLPNGNGEICGSISTRPLSHQTLTIISKNCHNRYPNAVSTTATMNGTASRTLAQLPDEMFSIIQTTAGTLSPRLARLCLPGRRIIDTPHYLASTSRGVVPHITQDTFRRDTSINGVYVALEDCMWRKMRALDFVERGSLTGHE